MPRCVAVFCGNTGEAGLGMFSFPRDPELNLIWRQNMKRTKSAREPNKLWENTIHSKLCGAHFEESCFQKAGPEREKTLGWKPGKRTLVPGAIPTVFKRSVNDTMRKPKPKRSAFEKRERKEAVQQILQEYEAKENGTSAIQHLQEDVTQKTEGVEPLTPPGMFIDPHQDIAGNEFQPASMDYPLPVYHFEPQTVIHPAEKLPQPTEKAPASSQDQMLEDNLSVHATDPCHVLKTTNVSNRENIMGKPPKRYHKKIQTPARWAAKPPATFRSFATQANPTMVDKGTQYDPPEEECQPTPAAPSVFKSVEEDLDTSFRSESTMDMEDDSDDPDYDPEMEMEMQDDDDIEASEEETRGSYLQPDEDVKKENKYVVFESSLIELLNFCKECGARANVRKNFTRGTFVELESLCSLCEDHKRVWPNQPVHNSLPVGNLLLAGTILFSGSSPVKAVNMLKFLRIATFCLRTYFRLQKAYLLPAINSVWYDVQSEVFAEVSGPLKLGGDARCCSPGHTAKYGSYTLMDLQTSKVVDMQLIQSNEVANSNAMELEGLKRCLQTLTDENIAISDLTTDRHPQVKKFMREQRPEINHWFDVWHVAKGVKKKVEAAGKRKGCAILCDWSQSISNHLYFCAASSRGDGELLEQMWCSLLNHVADIHEGHGSRFSKCLHGELEDRAWIKKDSKPHKELRDVIERRLLLKDIKKLSPSEQTYGLESFHKVCCFYATKFVHFFYQSMEGRLQLACFHFNENANRLQDVTKDGAAQWQISLPKYKQGAPVAKQIKVAATYNYVDKLLEEVMNRREELPSVQKSLDEIQPILAKTPRPVCSKYDKPNKKEVISVHRTRFSLENRLNNSV